MEEVLQADRVVALQDGRVAFGAPAEVFRASRNCGVWSGHPFAPGTGLETSLGGSEIPEGLLGEEALVEAVLRRWRELQ